MGLRSTITRLFPASPLVAWPSAVSRKLTTTNEEIEILFGRSSVSPARTYRLPSVAEAMAVPSIQGAVALISGTTGMLSVQGYRNGALMTETPRLLARPDPYQTPQAFYSGSAANMAKYGEIVWWIASRDRDGFATALVTVPLHELQVTENLRNRLRPDYQWGDKVGTRWTPANLTGQFVHVMYPTGEPMALRGSGPLQLCRAAVSVSVEAQAWAAQFYADGGDPSVLIKHAAELDPTLDEDGLSEADRLRAQWVGRPHNVPRIIDQNIESVEYKDANPNGAQMLEARDHQDGDSARMFRIPGPLLEYQQSGGSLTYQNRTDLKTEFWETCLQPLYVEPIEQALSDLMPRPIVARFNAKGYLRADVKTRFEVHGLAIDKGIYDAPYAQREEGILPGDVEFAPVPFSPPAAVPGPLPRYASAGLRDVRCTTCGRLIVRAAGAVEAWCRHCKAEVRAEDDGPSRTLAAPAVTVLAPSPDTARLDRIESLMLSALSREPGPMLAEGAIQLTINPAPAPDVSVSFPASEFSFPITVEPAAVSPPATPVTVNVAASEPTPIEVRNEITVVPSDPSPVEIHNLTTVEPTPLNITNEITTGEVNVRAELPADLSMTITSMPEQRTRITALPPQKRRVTKRDGQGRIVEVSEETEP